MLPPVRYPGCSRALRVADRSDATGSADRLARRRARTAVQRRLGRPGHVLRALDPHVRGGQRLRRMDGRPDHPCRRSRATPWRRAGMARRGSRCPVAPSTAERALFGLDRSPTGRMWAVGYRAKSSRYYPMVTRWNGTEWVVSSLGTIDDAGGALLSVRAKHDTSTWAVGYKVGEVRPAAARRETGGHVLAGVQPVARVRGEWRLDGHRHPEQRRCLGGGLGSRPGCHETIPGALERQPLESRNTGAHRLRGRPDLGRDRWPRRCLGRRLSPSSAGRLPTDRAALERIAVALGRVPERPLFDRHAARRADRHEWGSGGRGHQVGRQRRTLAWGVRPS